MFFSKTHRNNADQEAVTKDLINSDRSCFKSLVSFPTTYDVVAHLSGHV